jgi:putative Holliday junction resolvase
MRTLGVDFGIKRVGLAVTDQDGRMAFPLKTVERTTRDATFAQILDVIESENIEAVVVGLPLDLDGSETLTTRQAVNFAKSLARRTDKPVKFADERLSSAEAEERLHEAGVSGKKLKKALDSQAAVLILESFLAHGEFTLEQAGLARK